jgi:hypothetical protein
VGEGVGAASAAETFGTSGVGGVAADAKVTGVPPVSSGLPGGGVSVTANVSFDDELHAAGDPVLLEELAVGERFVAVPIAFVASGAAVPTSAVSMEHEVSVTFKSVWPGSLVLLGVAVVASVVVVVASAVVVVASVVVADASAEALECASTSLATVEAAAVVSEASAVGAFAVTSPVASDLVASVEVGISGISAEAGSAATGSADAAAPWGAGDGRAVALAVPMKLNVRANPARDAVANRTSRTSRRRSKRRRLKRVRTMVPIPTQRHFVRSPLAMASQTEAHRVWHARVEKQGRGNRLDASETASERTARLGSTSSRALDCVDSTQESANRRGESWLTQRVRRHGHR